MLENSEMGGAPRPNDATPVESAPDGPSLSKLAPPRDQIDEGTLKAIAGFQRYLDSMSHLEAMEAFGLMVDTPEPVKTDDETHEFAQRLLMELHAQALGSILDLAQMQALKTSEAQEIVRKVVAQLYEKLK